MPVFQKQAEGGRIVRYCFAVGEDEIRREVEASGRSVSAARIKALVQAERCACEVRKRQGSCCLGNVTAVAKAAEALTASKIGLAGRDFDFVDQGGLPLGSPPT